MVKNVQLRKIMLGMGVAAAAVLLILGINTATAYNAKRRIENAAKISRLGYDIDNLMVWMSDYPLTFRSDSQNEIRKAEGSVEADFKDLGAAYRGQASMTAELEEIEELYSRFAAEGQRMAEAYLKYDRVVGNSFAPAYHGDAQELKNKVVALIGAFDLDTKYALNETIAISVVAAVLIALILIVPTYLFATATVERAKAVLDFLDQ